jgi:mono/diheme cytochrome c family protein
MWLKRGLIALFGGLFVLGVGFAVLAWRPSIAEVDPPDRATFSKALIAEGAQLTLMGNCIDCHTNPGGRPYAGGRALQTPFGTIHSTNITPDTETGIGRWSQAAFLRSMHEGVGRDGRHLYPAFPYDHFTKLTADDVGAIYAFLMTRDPVRVQTPANELHFPFNARPLIAVWKLLFFAPGTLQDDASKAPEWNRGRYLVEALAHCGACHTPRNLLGAEKRDQFLAGGESDEWHAPALNAASPAPVPWTNEQLFRYLRRGFVDPHGVAAGPMRSVPDNLAEVPEQDVKAIAAFVGVTLVPATAGRPIDPADLMARPRPTETASRQQDAAGTSGSGTNRPATDAATIYAGACAPCHESSGRSFSARGIHLAQSKVVALPDPRNLIHVILEGIEPPAATPAASMPGFGTAFTDQDVAALAEFVRARFSDRPPWEDVQAQVRKLRKQDNGP